MQTQVDCDLLDLGAATVETKGGATDFQPDGVGGWMPEGGLTVD